MPKASDYDPFSNQQGGNPSNASSGGTWSGAQQTSDIFGQGQYGVTEYDINKGAYDKSADWAKQNEFLKGQAAGYQNKKAPTMQGVSAGSAAQAKAAQLGEANLAGWEKIGAFQNAQAAQGRGANISRAEDLQGRAAQLGLLGQLQTQAAGGGPSLAGAQLKQAQDRALAQQMAAASSGGGGNAAMRARQLATGAAASEQQTAQAAAQARMQEQLSAQQQVAGLASGMRAQDIGAAQAQAGLEQQALMAN